MTIVPEPLRSATAGRRRAARAAALGLTCLVMAACAPVNALVGVAPAPTEVVTGSLSATRAAQIADDLLTAAEESIDKTGKEGSAARAAAFTGPARSIADAQAKLLSTLSSTELAETARADDEPVVLAVSRGSAYPRLMIVQTSLEESGLPVLHLIGTTSVRTPYKIMATATMLSGAQVQAFDPLATGSPRLEEGEALVADPTELVTQYAASLNFPTPADDPEALLDDPFARQIRETSAENAKTMKAAATLTQTHEVDTLVGGLRTQGGAGALFFAVADRTDTVVNRSGGAITLSDRFVKLSGVRKATSEATTSTYEVVAIWLPVSGGGTVVAASEQLHAAKAK